MAESNETSENNVFSANDPLDINELASLNEDISNDLIEQLQNQLAVNANIKNDGDLFEEPSEEKKSTAKFNNDIDDNFIKKYKAKLNKKQNKSEPEADKPTTKKTEEQAVAVDMPHLEKTEEQVVEVDMPHLEKAEEQTQTILPEHNTPVQQNENVNTESASLTQIQDNKESIDDSVNPEVKNDSDNQPATDNIEAVSGGNIIEKPLEKTAVEYNESLDYLDNNVKYSKYVIYIDPENKDFIDSLTVKERKNLINRIIKEQDSIAITKRNFGKMQTIISHAIVAILTITIAIPCIYWTINASLEATINNYRASQTIFGQLYKEHGKIKTKTTNQR